MKTWIKRKYEDLCWWWTDPLSGGKVAISFLVFFLLFFGVSYFAFRIVEYILPSHVHTNIQGWLASQPTNGSILIILWLAWLVGAFKSKS